MTNAREEKNNMCGIAGMVTKSGALPDEALLRRMSSAVAHRGPDGEGVWTSSGVGLAHRRLAIIDLSDRGAQPMHDARGEITIVFNGEIYNYRELKQELRADWKSDSDTEVILEGYRAWGDDVVKRLRGMFAFAIWDAPRKRLLLARDRIGKKPLFYARTTSGDFLFASEIKAFRGVRDLKPDWNAIRLFLGLQYVPSPRTGFEGVSQLEPGSIGILDASGWRTEKYHVWEREPGAGNREQEIDREIRSRLDDAVKIRQLASDVSVGAFLSSGIDSAAVVAFASKHAERPLQTFTMGFPNAERDERDAARKIAEHFGTDHMDFEARPEHLLELIPTLVDHYDAPYADSSALPLWLLARETAKQIKVVLTGDGGDETFGGYRRYAAYQRALQMPSAAAPLFELTGRVVHDPRFIRMADAVGTHSYGELFCGSYFNTNGIQNLCTPEFLERTRESDAVAYVDAHAGPSLQDALRFDLTSYLPDDLNVKMDRATMAFGLEARSPFLDQDLVSFARSLPLNQKVNHGKTKIALKRALHGIVPDWVLNRPKQGFQVPLAEWFRGPLEQTVRDVCLDPSSPLRSLMKQESIQKLLEENASGADHGNRLWMLMTLATWLENYA
ncbi:asparagine synthase (glutamine-hydrolyzing) [Candidatus Uhrbacteria bacterium]|nr:asparagine synthase (glutamine-hydrolyzing) [Candidatus Uhrbacteria bacterium]